MSKLDLDLGVNATRRVRPRTGTSNLRSGDGEREQPTCVETHVGCSNYDCVVRALLGLLNFKPVLPDDSESYVGATRTGRTLVPRVTTTVSQRVMERRRAGATQKAIAAEFGIHRETVSRILRAGGVKKRQPVLGDEHLAEVRRLYEFGMSTPVIGRRYGVSQRTVHRFLTEHGVAIRGRRSDTGARR
jgi:Homeodomain-like domain